MEMLLRYLFQSLLIASSVVSPTVANFLSPRPNLPRNHARDRMLSPVEFAWQYDTQPEGRHKIWAIQPVGNLNQLSSSAFRCCTVRSSLPS